jgi:hypothetical protein
MKAVMRTFIAALLLTGACASDTATVDPTAQQTFEFGPYDLTPGQEVNKTCVQISLHNEETIFVNSVELTTGPGFHHSNWFFVPESTFAGEDGSWNCNDRNFNEPAAAVFGGVLFAQSTQSPHEIQQFPGGVALKIPPRSKIVSQIHLLNPTDEVLTVRPTIGIKPILEAEVTTLLAGISFEDEALGLPPHKQSRFSTECEIGAKHQQIFGRAPDFNIYYALAHYHELGTKLTVEAIKPTGETAMIYSTEHNVGDVLGGPIDPLFSMSGYTKLRLTCEFNNPRDQTVGWGVGDQEMCVFLAFSDSTYQWGGGVLEQDPPGNPMVDGDMMTFSNSCSVYAIDATR